MTDLEKIESSDKLKMALSELLFEKLGMGCWHKDIVKPPPAVPYICGNCGSTPHPNPNLFTRESFLTVFNIAKGLPYIKQNSLVTGDIFHRFDEDAEWLIEVDAIDSPYFQYKLLKWLLELDNEEKRLEKILDPPIFKDCKVTNNKNVGFKIGKARPEDERRERREQELEREE